MAAAAAAAAGVRDPRMEARLGLFRAGGEAWPCGAPIVACFGTRSDPDAFTFVSVVFFWFFFLFLFFSFFSFFSFPFFFFFFARFLLLCLFRRVWVVLRVCVFFSLR